MRDGPGLTASAMVVRLRSLLFVATATVSLARPAPLVHTALGPVRGNALGEADEFLGLPYASAARFEAAIPRSEPFATSPLAATYYGPACKQVLTSTSTYGVEHGCHVLNVWRPAGTTSGAKLPVMLYVPGGSNDFGEAEPYNASQMAAHQNSVITSINYRVGPFGFAALRDDSRQGRTTGNHALTDIQAALRFLRAHIGAFGGDPSRVSLFGQSSGGGLAILHATIPSSAGLFAGVLSQSGSLSASRLASSLATTSVLATALNCTRRGYSSTKLCLLNASDDALVYAQGVSCLTPNQCSSDTSWSPTVDGVLIPDTPLSLVAAGKVNAVNVALGANTNDSYLFISTEGPLRRAAYTRGLEALAYGDAALAKQLLDLYPPKPGWLADNIDRKGWYASDRMLCSFRRTAKALAHAPPLRGRAFLYRYDYWFQSNAVRPQADRNADPQHSLPPLLTSRVRSLVRFLVGADMHGRRQLPPARVWVDASGRGELRLRPANLHELGLHQLLAARMARLRRHMPRMYV